MAARRPGSVCMLCQARQATIGRRRFTASGRRRLEKLALVPADDGFPFGSSVSAQQHKLDGSTRHIQKSKDKWQKSTVLEDNLLDLDDLWRTSVARQAVLRKLSNPWPDESLPKERGPSKGPETYKFAEVEAGPIPHVEFRHLIRELATTHSSEKYVRYILRGQLLRCSTPQDLLKMLAVVMQHDVIAAHLSSLHEPIIRCLYRCRAHVSDPEVLRLLNIIVGRFDVGGLALAPDLLYLGMKFAARARSLPSMKRYLRLFRVKGITMSSHMFRSVIAKFSIGHRGLGEIRNGRWRRDELWQVLTGFDDATHLPPEQQYHIEKFLIRSDWQYLHGWVAVVSRCRDSELVWREWSLWKQSDQRTRPKQLASMNTGLTSKVRGEYWFLEQMTITGDLEKAWRLFEETDLPFLSLKDRVRKRMLDGIEYATKWSEDIRQAMVWKYDLELLDIEHHLGIRWVPGAVDGEGFHEMVEDQEEVLDRLGAEDFKPVVVYGYPTVLDEDVMGSLSDMALQHAEEQGLAEVPSGPSN